MDMKSAVEFVIRQAQETGNIVEGDYVGEDNLYCNPGAISFPRDDSPRGYMILEDNTFTWKTLDGTAYHTEVL